jgi:hypothetical protein
MSKPPLPEAAVAMLRKPNPAVITTLRQDGQPDPPPPAMSGTTARCW